MIEENVKNLLKELEQGNCFNEKVTLVVATKTVCPENINRAIEAGITDVGENKVNEFKDKYDEVKGANRHFIGHLQLNKVKYLIGKTYLYHSLDRLELADEINKRSFNAKIISNVLIQINIGKEDSKSGFYIEDADKAYTAITELCPNLKIKGFMAMLPLSEDDAYLKTLCIDMRKLFDKYKAINSDIEYLSMGMSGDYIEAIKCGSTMIRIGTALFGQRQR